MACSTCGGTDHNARSCAQPASPKAGKKANAAKARTEGGRRKGTAKPTKVVAMPAPREGLSVNGNLAEHIRQLRADVERGKAAEHELAEVRKLLA